MTLLLSAPAVASDRVLPVEATEALPLTGPMPPLAMLPGMPVLPPLPLPDGFRAPPVAVDAAPVAWARFRDRLIAVAADHPRRDAARAVIGGAEGRVTEARAAQYPAIDLGFDASRRLADNGIDALDSRIRSSDDRSDAVLTARQLIYDGGATFDRIDGARARVSASRAEDVDEAALLIRDAVLVYLDVVEARTRLALAEAETAAYLTLEERIAERRSLGGGTEGDEVRIRARLADARASRAAATRSLDQARQAYVELYGAAPGDDLALPPRPDAPTVTDDALALIETASPALAARRDRERAARFDADAAAATDWPELSLQVQGRRYDVLDGGRESDLVGRMVVSMPLYDGGARGGRQAQARAAMRAAEAETARLRRILTRDVTAAIAARAARDAELGALIGALAANERARDIFRGEFEAGVRDLLDLIEVERDYHLAASRLVSGRVEAERAHWRLLEASGVLRLHVLDGDGPIDAMGAGKVGETE